MIVHAIDLKQWLLATTTHHTPHFLRQVAFDRRAIARINKMNAQRAARLAA